MKKLLIGLSAIVMLFLSGCAPTVPMAPSSKDSIAKSFKKDKQYANVYLCRNSFIGSAGNMAVLVDGKLAGETNAYSFFYWKMKPGKHIIQSTTGTTDSLTFNTKSNTNYFIIQQMRIGGAKLKIVDDAEGQKCVLATKMLKSKLHMSSYEKKTSMVEPTYVSPVKYKKYSCTQISKEIEKIRQRSFALSDELEDTNKMAANMMGTGPIFFLGAAISSSATEDEKVELGKLKGEYNALKTRAKQKKCKFASKL